MALFDNQWCRHFDALSKVDENLWITSRTTAENAGLMYMEDIQLVLCVHNHDRDPKLLAEYDKLGIAHCQLPMEDDVAQESTAGKERQGKIRSHSSTNSRRRKRRDCWRQLSASEERLVGTAFEHCLACFTCT
jgi:hypothetical protein